MANIIGVKWRGGTLCLFSDDSQVFPTVHVLAEWYQLQTPITSGTHSITHLKPFGDLYVIGASDGQSWIAYPNVAGQWICDPIPVGGNPNPPPQTIAGDNGTSGNGTQVVSPLPSTFSAKDANGNTWTFQAYQIKHAADIITTAFQIPGMTNAAIVIAFITGMVESSIRVLSNVSHYPISATYPHDGDGNDHNSVGIYQQQPNYGWGTVQSCMDVAGSTRSFIGGPNGPRQGRSPRGLFDVAGWQTMSPGVAAQSVQGSAFPDRYQVLVPVAQALLSALLAPLPTNTAAWRWPFQYSRWVIQTGPYAALAQYGWRTDPFTGKYAFHAGLDFGAGGINGLPIPCAADGTVKEAAYNSSMGNHVLVTHSGGFETHYFHMNNTPPVKTGQSVAKGQTLGYVGMTGWATGPHLHWETLVNGATMNPRQFMKDRGVPES